MSQLGPPEWIAIVSATVAFVGAGISLFGARAATKTAALAREAAEARAPNLVVRIERCFIRRGDPKARWYALAVSVSNRADTDNSIAAAELYVRYRRGEMDPVQLVVAHDPLVAPILVGKDAPALHIPLSVAAHQTTAGWLVFELIESLIGGTNIEGIALQLRDTHDMTYSVEPLTINEVLDEEAPEAKES